MRIAVLGDIHANLQALQTVLADVDEHAPDRIVAVGDVVGYGANPSECLSLLRDRGIGASLGNWEMALSDDKVMAGFNPGAQQNVYFTRDALSDEEKAFLAALPLSLDIEGAQVLHGFPGDPCRYVKTEEDARAAFEATDAQVVFFGHTHVPLSWLGQQPISQTKHTDFLLPNDMPVLVNVGAVGQPRDGDPRAAWCLYDSDTRRVRVMRRQYDVYAAAGAILREGLMERSAERLLEGE